MQTLLEKISSNVKVILFTVLLSMVLFMIIILNVVYIPDLFSISIDILSAKNNEISSFLQQNITKIETMANFIDPTISIRANVNRLTNLPISKPRMNRLGWWIKMERYWLPMVRALTLKIGIIFNN